MGRRNRKKKIEKIEIRSGFSLRIISSLVVAFIVAGSVGLLVVSSYTGFGSPPIPKTLVRAADITIASFPLLPKNPNQVLAKSLFETSRISSGEHKFNLDLTQDIGEGKENSLFSVEITGPFTKSDNQIDLAGKASLSFPNEEESSKVEFVEEDDFIFFRLENTPDFFGLDLTELQGNWFKLDLTKILSDAKASTRSDEEIEKTTTEKIRTILSVIEAGDLNKNIKVLPDENIEGENNYHFQLNFSEEQTKKILKTISEDSPQLPDIKTMAIDLWINKTDFILKKLVISGIVSSAQEKPSEGVTLNLPDVNFELSYELVNSNKIVTIDTPDESKDLSSLLELYLLVKSDEEADPTSVVLGAVSNLGEFGANFLTIERLIHVLYLIPQSF